MTEEVEEFIEKIDELRSDDRYRFAEETLLGIRTTVISTDVVTPRQRQAIFNIYESTTAKAGC